MSTATSKFQLTPARGGRPLVNADTPAGFVSTHARARRATLGVYLSEGLRGFQLTPARGGRPRRFQVSVEFGVSTHARARRATAGRGQLWLAQGFNSRPRAAGDNHCLGKSGVAFLFQLTPARGGRLLKATETGWTNSFNSRPRAAGDLSVPMLQCGCMFQLTPARGGRQRETMGA